MRSGGHRCCSDISISRLNDMHHPILKTAEMAPTISIICVYECPNHVDFARVLYHYRQ